MSLKDMYWLLNKYPGKLIDQQFSNALHKFNINEPLNLSNYSTIRQKVIDTPYEIKQPIDHGKPIFVYFT